jgi:hypothetical protein
VHALGELAGDPDVDLEHAEDQLHRLVPGQGF